MRRQHIGLLAPVAAIAALFLLAPTAAAQAGELSPQYQGYGTTAGGQDPYANSNPQDVHVDGYGGQRVVTGYIKINLDSLPQGVNIDGLTLSLTPNSSQSDNVNTSAANIQACLLTQPLTANGYQSTPPSDDCTLPHAKGELQANGTWHFELAPLAQYWEKNQNDGLALAAYAPANDTGLPVDPSAWAIGFDHTKTSATVDYTGGSSSDIFGPPPTSSSSSGFASTAPAPAPAVVLPEVPPPAGPSTAPAVATPVPSSTPSAAAAPAQTPVAGSATTSSPRLSQQWIWLTIALGVATLLLLVVGASQQLLRGGRLNLGAAGAALSASRSQLATPIATLALGAVFALGFSGQLVSASNANSGAFGGGSGVAGSGSGAGASAGPSAGSGPGAGPSGAAAPGASSGAPGAPGGTSGGGAVASNGNTIGGANGVGVTATTVRIGFIHITNTQSANQAFGVNVPNPGDGQAEEQALVDYVNKHGGLGGRQIVPVYVAVDNAKAESDPNIGEEQCKQLTEDDHVWAVVAGGGAPDAIAADACYAQHGTLNLDAADSGMSLSFLRQASPYIFMNQAVALDRGMRWEIAGLQSRGYFAKTPTYKLGVVVAGDTMNDTIYNQVTKPAALAAGAASVESFPVPHDTISDIANTMKQAVIRFQADNVTNVMFQGGANYGQGSYALLFMINAESQHYNPRYGLSTDDAPIALVGSVPQDQFKDAVAVGWMPAADTDDQHYQPWPYTAGEKSCASIEAAAGNSFTSREGAIAILAFCSDMFELQLGAQGLTTLNAQLWANHVMQLGYGGGNVLMYRGYVGPDHWDGAGGYRLLHAVQNCEQDSNGKSTACFEYDNGNVYGG